VQTLSPVAARVVADTHVHLYPCYDLGSALSSLAGNLARIPAGAHAAFLAERRDCRAFAALREGTGLPPRPGVAVGALPEPGSLLLTGGDGVPVYLFAGRQLVTAERIEVLALLLTDAPPEGLDAGRTIEAILAAGGVPVLGWSPGKWWGGRGRCARGLLERFGDSLLLGDTALRPSAAPEPPLMREARRHGSGVIAGTDPLPFPGEERLLGSYASVFEGTIDPQRPVESARRLLRLAAARATTAGSRSSWPAAARRWLRNARAGGGTKACAA
jgi:hypothetical protein